MVFVPEMTEYVSGETLNLTYSRKGGFKLLNTIVTAKYP